MVLHEDIAWFSGSRGMLIFECDLNQGYNSEVLESLHTGKSLGFKVDVIIMFSGAMTSSRV